MNNKKNKGGGKRKYMTKIHFWIGCYREWDYDDPKLMNKEHELLWEKLIIIVVNKEMRNANAIDFMPHHMCMSHRIVNHMKSTVQFAKMQT